MKLLLNLSIFLFLCGCSLNQIKDISISHKFPEKYCGSYKKTSGSDYGTLMREFKISSDYFTVKNKNASNYSEEQFFSYIINNIYLDSGKFIFNVDSAYGSYEAPSGHYVFELSGDTNKVYYSMYDYYPTSSYVYEIVFYEKL